MPTPILLRRRKLGKGSCNGIAAVSTTGITPVRHWRQRDWDNLPNDSPRMVFRWGCTANIQNQFDPDWDHEVINSAQSIHWCSNKRESRLAMREARVPVPITWETFDDFDWDEHAGGTPGCPVIVRPGKHSQGRYMWICQDRDRVRSAVEHSETVFGSYYISKVIPKIREYRVAIIQNRVAWVAQKTPADASAIAWNVAQGGRFDNVRWDNWPRESIKAALAAMKLSGADFGGVDVMEDAEGKLYVLEINSAPSQTSPYRQSCFAKCFDWIVRNGKEHFEDLDNPRRLKDFRHPALMETL